MKHIRRRSEKPQGKTPEQILAQLGLTKDAVGKAVTNANTSYIVKKAEQCGLKLR